MNTSTPILPRVYSELSPEPCVSNICIKKLTKKVISVCIGLTHKGWDLRDYCTEVKLSVSWYSWFPDFPWVSRVSQSKFEANRSRGSWVMIGQPNKQTNTQTEITTSYIEMFQPWPLKICIIKCIFIWTLTS